MSGTYQHNRARHYRPTSLAGLYRAGTRSTCPVPAYVEIGYYFYVFHDILGGLLPISVPMLGGGTLLLLAGFCVNRLGLRNTVLSASNTFPVACAASYLVLQVAVHNASLSSEYLRPFVFWILLLIVTQSLCLRAGFFHRFALVIFVIGLVTLPYLKFELHTYDVDRATFDQSTLSSLADPNLIAAWFGFCAIYFISAGMQIKRVVVRIISWSIAFGCLGIVGLTVSRGALLAVLVATVVALRHLLRRGFIPLMILVTMTAIVYTAGLFHQFAAPYTARGTEETGRLLVWPLVIERILSYPLAGVGVTDIGTYVAETGWAYTPHNPFLFIALASGIIPFAFYVGYWWRLGRAAILSGAERKPEGPFLLPVFTYSFLIIQGTNLLFTIPLIVTPLSLLTLGSVSHRIRRIVYPRSNTSRLLSAQKLGVRNRVRSSGMAVPTVVRSQHKPEPKPNQ